MKPIARNYYTALLFKERPDLHMTLQYYKQRSPWELAQLIIKVNDEVVKFVYTPPIKLLLNKQGWFGPGHDVRVLELADDERTPTSITTTIWPPFVKRLTPKQWRPHITCLDKSLVLTVVAVAIMYKDVEIVRWKLC